jgi:hypothetical protein
LTSRLLYKMYVVKNIAPFQKLQWTQGTSPLQHPLPLNVSIATSESYYYATRYHLLIAYQSNKVVVVVGVVLVASVTTLGNLFGLLRKKT